MAVSEWNSNGSRRRKCMSIVLAPDEQGNPPACQLCGMPGADSVDHILPKVHYPELVWELSNMQPAHQDCNKAKGARVPKPEIGKNSRLW